MIKLAVFDLDDTLLTPQKTLPQQTIDAITKLKDQGTQLAIATGRNYEMAKPFAQMLGIEGPIICDNGALIKTVKTGESLQKRFVDKSAQSYVIDYALKHNHLFIVYTTEGLFTPSQQRIDVYESWNERFPSSPTTLILSNDITKMKRMDAYKIVTVIEDPDVLKKVYSTFKTIDNAHATQSSRNFIDIVEKDVNKGAGIKFLMEYYQVSPQEILVFGDSDNDSEMLALAEHSYAMKNATKAAKHYAKHITDKNAVEGGVRDTLKQYYLNSD